MQSTSTCSQAHDANAWPSTSTAELVLFALPMQDLSSYQQSHKLTRLPSVLEWLSFVFASGNLLAGPYFELSDYLNFVERKGPWDPASRQPSTANQYKAGVMLLAKPPLVSSWIFLVCVVDIRLGCTNINPL